MTVAGDLRRNLPKARMMKEVSYARNGGEK